MSDPVRYRLENGQRGQDPWMAADERGDYVHYEDHREDITTLSTRLAQAERERDTAEQRVKELELVLAVFKHAPQILRSAEKWTHGHELRVDLLRIASEYEQALASAHRDEGATT